MAAKRLWPPGSWLISEGAPVSQEALEPLLITAPGIVMQVPLKAFPWP